MRPVLVELGFTLVGMSLLGIFYEKYERNCLMKDFVTKVSEVVLEDRANVRVKASGIVDFNLGEYREEIVDMFSGAKRTILICKTWIPDGDMDLVMKGLEKAFTNAFEEKRELEVKILCLSPASPIAKQRSCDLKKSPNYGRTKIKDNLDRILAFCDQKGVRTHPKIYDNLPAISLYATEQTALMGWYWADSLSFEGPVLRVDGEGSVLGKKARDTFKEVWDKAIDYR